MRSRLAALAVLALSLALSATAMGAGQPSTPNGLALDHAVQIAREVERTHPLAVNGVTTTAGVATLELFDPASETWRSVPAGNGIHFTLCGSVLRRCALPARAARAQALALARRTLLETSVSLVVVALPQTATRHVQIVFERDLLDSPEVSADRSTGERLYAMAGLVTAGTGDSLLLVKLR